MAKFTCIPKLGKEGGGVVWDAETNKAIARFDKNGLFETDDKAVIEKLQSFGFMPVGGAPKKTPAKKETAEPPKEKAK